MTNIWAICYICTLVVIYLIITFVTFNPFLIYEFIISDQWARILFLIIIGAIGFFVRWTLFELYGK